MWDNLWVFSCVILLLGAVFAIVGMVLRYRWEQDEIYQGRAEAKVVEIRTEPYVPEHSLPQFRNRQIAVFQFIVGGNVITVDDNSDAFPCPYELNQKVKICYNKKNPEQYRLFSANFHAVFSRVVYDAGIAFICTGVALFFVYAVR